MYKVMIADDEIYITVLLARLVDWAAFDMEIVAVCHNGDEAYRQASEMELDLIVLDVRMPGIDGIALMQKLRVLNQKTKFIVISGHRSFDFAKGAIQNDAEDYLLKPISREELENVLRRTREKLDDDRADREKLTRTDEESEKINESLRRHAMRFLLDSQGTGETSMLETVERDYNIRLSEKMFMALQLVFDHLPSDEAGLGEELYAVASAAVRNGLSDCCKQMLYTMQDNRMSILLNLDPAQTAALVKALDDVLYQLNERLDRLDHSVATLCQGRSFHELLSVKAAFQSIRECAEARVGMGVGGVVRAEDIRRNDGIVDAIFADYEAIINDAIRSFNADKLSDCVRDMLLRADVIRGDDVLACWTLARRTMGAMYDYLHGIDLLKEQSFEQFTADCERELLYAYTPQLLIRALTRFIGTKLGAFAVQPSDGKRPEFHIAQLYIREHYMEQISLADVAAVVNYNPIYFSMAFKREVGIGFSDYLTQVRIKMATTALRDVKYSINEVAARCGFENAKYFSQVFRKNVGITPTEYRKRHLNSESSAEKAE